MEKSDVPYVILTIVFSLAIFIAGRASAPVKVTEIPAPPTAPSILVITSAAAPSPPLALLPEVPEAPEPPTVVASVAPYTTLKKPTPVGSSRQSGEPPPSRIAPEPVFLEESPALPDNPYTAK